MSPPVQFVPVTTPQQIDAVAGLAREIWYEYYVPLIGRAQVDYMVAKFQSSGAVAAQLREGYEYFLIERGAISAPGRASATARCSPSRRMGSLFLSKLYLLTRRPRRGNRPGLHGVH